jgi:regulator of protease activity HflC (stomatin/prohibitin superfamily)
MNNEEKNMMTIGISIIIGIVLLIALIWGLFALGAIYSVWSSGLAGEAELKQADWNRQIAVREALAKKESAIALAQAEIERAKGVAQANKIIGDSLRNNEEYLRYLWIDGLQNTKNQVIYIPTEGNLPILEANRFNNK